MYDSQGYYRHEEEIIGLHVIMGKAETKSNGRRDRKELVTMRNLHRKVKIYRFYNEMIMKDQEELLKYLNMMHNKVNKYSITKQESSVIQVSPSKSHIKRDDHGNDS
jgi:hypothetical protein